MNCNFVTNFVVDNKYF